MGYILRMNELRFWLVGALPLALAACGDEPQTPAPQAPPAVTEPDPYEFKLNAPREIVTRDKAFRVSWIRGDHNFQTGHMGENRFGALAMGLTTENPATRRHSDHQRAGEITV